MVGAEEDPNNYLSCTPWRPTSPASSARRSPPACCSPRCGRARNESPSRGHRCRIVTRHCPMAHRYLSIFGRGVHESDANGSRATRGSCFAVSRRTARGASAAPAARLQPPSPHSSGLARASSVFLDGFESASTCPWSAVQPPDAATCSNGLEDGCETDVDCGGRSCATCPDFDTCLVDGDCQSGMCSNGICAQCLTTANCPGVDTDCAFRTCIKLACGIDYAPSGTPTSSQIRGDCQLNVCDGVGRPGERTRRCRPPRRRQPMHRRLCVSREFRRSTSKPAGTPCAQNGGATATASATASDRPASATRAKPPDRQVTGEASRPSDLPFGRQPPRAGASCGRRRNP